MVPSDEQTEYLLIVWRNLRSCIPLTFIWRSSFTAISPRQSYDNTLFLKLLLIPFSNP
jgi:hypothetical protein